eukprot:COSAG05_NODE_8261_length_721_cov_0.963023_1_plen_36_part_10
MGMLRYCSCLAAAQLAVVGPLVAPAPRAGELGGEVA